MDSLALSFSGYKSESVASVEILAGGRHLAETRAEDGPWRSCRFLTAKRLCCCGAESLVIADHDRIRRLSATTSMAEFLQALLRCTVSFGFKTNDVEQRPPTHSPSEASQNVRTVLAFMESCHDQAWRAVYDSDRATNGPDGAFGTQTRTNLALLEGCLTALARNLDSIFDQGKICIRTLLTYFF